MFASGQLEWKILQLANLYNSQNAIFTTGAQGSSSHPWSNSTLSGPSISLSGLSFDYQSHVKKYQVCEIEQDLLALSTTWHRLRKSQALGGHNHGITSLTDLTLTKHVTQIDHDKAAQVRDYYSKKIMMWKLKEQKLSKFREDMNLFIHSDGKIFREDMQPLAYRLPEFYEYDSEFDTLTSEFNKYVKQKEPHMYSKKTLTLAKTFVVGKKYSKRKEYWFSDESNDLVHMSFTTDNPLLTLLDMYTKQPITVDAIYSKRYRDNSEYLIANKFKFA